MARSVKLVEVTMGKCLALDGDSTLAKLPVVQRVEYVVNVGGGYLVISLVSQKLHGLLVGEEGNKSRDKGDVLKNGLGTAGVAKITLLVAVWTNIESFVAADKATARLDAAMVLFRLQPR